MVFDQNVEVEQANIRLTLREATQQRRQTSLTFNGRSSREILEARVASLRAARQHGAAPIPPASSAAAVSPHNPEAHVIGTPDQSLPGGQLLHPESSPAPQRERPAAESEHPQYPGYKALHPMHREAVGSFSNFLHLKRTGTLESTMQAAEEIHEHEQTKLRQREAAREKHRDFVDPRQNQSPASNPKGPG